MKAAKSKPKKPPEPPRVLPPLPEDAVLLSVDASSTAVGWSVWRGGKFAAASVINSKANTDPMERIRGHSDELKAAVDEYGVTHAIAESQSHKVSPIHLPGGRVAMPQGLAILGKSQGYLLCMLDVRLGRSRVETTDEHEWIKHFDGKNLKKEKRAEYVKLMVPQYAEYTAAHPTWDRGLDVADSLGIGLFRLGIKVDIK